MNWEIIDVKLRLCIYNINNKLYLYHLYPISCNLMTADILVELAVNQLLFLFKEINSKCESTHI